MISLLCFIFSRASDKLWASFDKDELVPKEVMERRERSRHEVKKIMASQPEEEGRKIVQSTLKELGEDVQRREKKRLKKTESKTPPPQVRLLTRFFISNCIIKYNTVIEAICKAS